MFRYFACVAVLWLVGCFSVAQAKDFEINLGKFVQETQFTEQSKDGFCMVWWVPTEYWQESFRKAAMTQSQKDEFLKGVDDYIIVAVVDGKLSALGNSNWRTGDEMRKDLSIRIGNGEAAVPLKSDEIAQGTQALLQVMKPMFRKMMGDIGAGMELICFKGKGDDGKHLLDPKTTGRFQVTYRDKPYNWRLPLGSLMPPKIDATSGETFPGNYLFNPYTGAKLTEK